MNTLLSEPIGRTSAAGGGLNDLCLETSSIPSTNISPDPTFTTEENAERHIERIPREIETHCRMICGSRAPRLLQITSQEPYLHDLLNSTARQAESFDAVVINAERLVDGSHNNTQHIVSEVADLIGPNGFIAVYNIRNEDVRNYLLESFGRTDCDIFGNQNAQDILTFCRRNTFLHAAHQIFGDDAQLIFAVCWRMLEAQQQNTSPLNTEKRTSPHQIGSGQSNELAELYQEFANSMTDQLTRSLKDRNFAEEVTQESFLRLGKLTNEEFQGIRSKPNFLMRIAHNIVRDTWRRREHSCRSSLEIEFLPQEDEYSIDQTLSQGMERLALVDHLTELHQNHNSTLDMSKALTLFLTYFVGFQSPQSAKVCDLLKYCKEEQEKHTDQEDFEETLLDIFSRVIEGNEVLPLKKVTSPDTFNMRLSRARDALYELTERAAVADIDND